DEAKKAGETEVSPEFFLLGLLSNQLRDTGAARALRESGLTGEKLVSALKKIQSGGASEAGGPQGKFKALQKYCRDLTALAREQKLDPVIGRDEEIRRVVQVLSRRTKNNPVLIGEPGVGK